MKKIFVLTIILLVSILGLTGCNGREKLLVLNWGEYINDDMVDAFEKEFGVDVIISLADSNELFYSKVKSGTTAYDIVIPSEYMVEKMIEKDLLQKLDFSKLPNYDLENNPFMPDVQGIMEDMALGSSDYMVPYFWGTFGLMYNKLKPGLEEAITKKGWDAFFKEDNLPTNTRVGMYDVPRFAFAASMFYNRLNPNPRTTEELNFALKKSKETFEMRKFTSWGTDTLKKDISANNLDLAFVYTGDFLDVLYTKLEDGVPLEKVTFDIHIPNETMAFLDSMVILKNARHVDLAHKFINFFLEWETVAYENAGIIGYCTPLLNTYLKITSEDNDRAIAIKRYYPYDEHAPKGQYRGTALANIDKDNFNKINILINNMKAH